jgi:hypothetical protein
VFPSRALVLSILLPAIYTASDAKLPRGHRPTPKACARALSPLSGAEIEYLVQRNVVMQVTGERGCPGSMWSLSLWNIHFQADGSAVRYFDRGHDEGRYFIRHDATATDRLCLATISSWVEWRHGDSRPSNPFYRASINCYTLYRDALHRLYLRAEGMPGGGPAMVTLNPIR